MPWGQEANSPRKQESKKSFIRRREQIPEKKCRLRKSWTKLLENGPWMNATCKAVIKIRNDLSRLTPGYENPNLMHSHTQQIKTSLFIQNLDIYLTETMPTYAKQSINTILTVFAKFLSEKQQSGRPTGLHPHTTGIWAASVNLVVAQMRSQSRDNKMNHFFHKALSHPFGQAHLSPSPKHRCSGFWSLLPYLQSL